MNVFSKDNAIELLCNGEFEEFNSTRSCDEIELLDLSEADFSEISLKGVDFSYVDLTGANFSEAEISEVDFSNSDLTAANFSRATLEDVNFTESILNGTSFRNVECQADFSEADLSGADFCEGDFEASDFSLSENMSMCKFDVDTVWPDNSDMPDDFDSTCENAQDEDDSGNEYY